MDSQTSRFHTYHGTGNESHPWSPTSSSQQRHLSLLGRNTTYTAPTSNRHWETIHLRDSSYFHKYSIVPLTSQVEQRRVNDYACLLSIVAQSLIQQLTLTNRFKNNIEYPNAFDGQQVVDKLMTIIGSKDRVVALKLGRALGMQGCFHDVQYESLLMDSSTEIYQFKDVLLYYFQRLQLRHQHQQQRMLHQISSPSARPFSLIPAPAQPPSAASSVNGSILSEQFGPVPGNVTTSSGSISEFSISTDDQYTTPPTTISDEEDIKAALPHIASTRLEGVDDDNMTVLTSPSTATDNSTLTSSSLDLDAICPLNGVFTPLTYCYVSTCTGPQPCYSPTCPKRNKNNWKHTSIESKAATLHTYLRRREKTSWAAVVPDDVLASVSTDERKRQEAICELVNTEANFVMDLDYVEKMWVEPLLEQDTIPLHRRTAFVNTLFTNIVDIHRYHGRFARALQRRQQEHPIIGKVGDIVLKYCQDLSMIVTYGAHLHEAKTTFEKEKLLNSKFNSFAEYTEHHPSSHKLELNGYLTRPTTRLGQYPLLFKAILKRTSPSHPDYALLNEADELVKATLNLVNSESGHAKNRFDLARIHRNLSFKRKTDRLDLKLLDPSREIIREGFLNKRPTLEAADYQVILFDHYLVVAKVKWVRAEKHYVVVRRPLPIAFLSVSLPSLPSNMQRSSSFLLSASRYSGHLQTGSYFSNESNPDTRFGQPIVFQHMGRKKDDHSQFTLYATSQAARKPWIDHIYQLQSRNASPSSVLDVLPAVKTGQFIHSRVKHMVTFSNNQLLVFAADDGVYAGKNAPDAQVHKVLSLPHATRVYVIEDFQMLLVLADKTLWQFGLTEVMNGNLDGTTQASALGKRLYTNVPFFHAGVCLDRTLICVPTKVSPLKSVITVLEPCKPQAMTDKKPSLLDRLVRPTNTSISTTDCYLRKFRECYVPCEAWAVDTTTSKLMVTAHRGIEIIDLQRTDRTQSMLNHQDPLLYFVTQSEKRESNLKIRVPMKHISVFRSPLSEYLVCYNEFAFYIDAKGNRAYRKFLIEWEGCSESYAMLWPYVMSFDPSIIEIRNALTGHLEQVVRGDNIRCIQNREGDAIYVAMSDPKNRQSDCIVRLTLMHPPSDPDGSNKIELTMEPCSALPDVL
ncbi:hypothetical protein DM01DRAFT_1333659 [Hesseltinella vesiculosa]|uniref:CNH-domain-containing protein n=1 Tax=Hesseltinella vesiculosa TaxID=101127 RepID=A0A1X2GPV6_9FUNG|nr:hypothetical protein DM01DRAFT_1333659 [Hesseltinella vesiculosa]